jgi:hypothetical protein
MRLFNPMTEDPFCSRRVVRDERSVVPRAPKLRFCYVSFGLIG